MRTMTDKTKTTEAEVIRLLKNEPLIHSAPGAVIEAFAKESEVIRCQPREKIVSKDSSIDACYFLMSGQVSLILEMLGNRKITIDTLRNGACFGTSCLYENPIAEYTYMVGEETTLLILEKARINRVLERFPEEVVRLEDVGRIQPVYRLISKLELFRSLPVALTRDIARKLERKRYSAGKIIFQEGDVADNLYIVERGSVQVYHEKAKDRILVTLLSGAVLGEIALVDNSRRTASVRAAENTSMLLLDRQEFLSLLKEQEDLNTAIKALVGQRLVRSAKFLDTLSGLKRKTAPSIELPPPAVTPPKRFGDARYPEIRQQSQMDCSAACITMVCTYYGTRVSLNTMRETLRIGRSGTSMANIICGAREIGFATVAYKSTWEQLETAPLPAITNWNGYHWIVIYKVEKNHITVSDPALGRRRYTRAEFEKSWTRFTIFLSPTEQFRKLKPAKRSFKLFLHHILPHKHILGEIMIASLTLKFLAIFLPLLNMHIIDNVMMKREEHFFLPSIFAVAVLTLLQLLTTYFRQNLLLYVSQKISLSVLSGFYRHLLSLPLTYFEARQVGDITTRFGQNTVITNFLTNIGFQIFLDLLTAIVVSGIFFAISPMLMLLTFGFIMLDILQVYFASPVLQRNYQATFVKMAEVQSHFIESLNGMKTIKALGISHLMRWKYEKLYTAYMNVQLQGELISAVMGVVSGFASSFSRAALLLTGAYMVLDGKMSVGGLVAFLSMVGYVHDPLVNIIRSWGKFQETLNAVERVNDIYDTKPEIAAEEKEDLLELPPLLGNIEFSNLTFRYKEDAQDNILQNIRLKIQAGQKVAFVGRSGSGKSTLVKLLYGFYRANSGDIVIDGFKIKDCWLPSLRQQIGVVLQEDFLFEGTIRDNIARGRSSASFGDIVEAAKRAAAHEFISKFPEGYETVVKDKGANFSGGQRQCICLARTLLQDPRMLIMDEGTSAIDNESERFVINNIYEHFKDRTVIMIAHRLSTIKNCDIIYVLDKGTIIEKGTHEALMKQRGTYYLLNSRQMA